MHPIIPAIDDKATNLQRQHILAWMAALCVEVKEMRAAEGYMLELLAWCAFSPDDRNEVLN